VARRIRCVRAAAAPSVTSGSTRIVFGSMIGPVWCCTVVLLLVGCTLAYSNGKTRCSPSHRLSKPTSSAATARSTKSFAVMS
jgi:hypothetical protein